VAIEMEQHGDGGGEGNTWAGKEEDNGGWVSV